MNSLSPSDAEHLRAAQEFLKAGEIAQAGAALAQLPAAFSDHPDVLEIRWELLAQEQQWDQALEVARKLREAAPENHFGWMYQGASLAELKRVREAYDLLAQAAEKFTQVPIIPYNLACCACKLKRLGEAAQWLSKAAERGGRLETKLMAMDDPDLAPILDHICAL